MVVLSYISGHGRQDNIQKGTEHVFPMEKKSKASMQIIISYHSIYAIECSYELSHHQLNHKYNITYMGVGVGGLGGGGLPSP